ncbi:UDP-glucose dehydrogenase family protein [Methanoculleus sp. UBA303]|jgi:UDPglucose 6-dehydrogenase|uniref:UDP-glucose dehydrogenase family protein n=1 Tax=Methanoculleus sp. UBA303 TaxID=1915497 RepID=UPI0025DDE675|nr:UDP-glucose/GDP-mannose dehydrogenase family protein [Methanoculleus sp. UBA303]
MKISIIGCGYVGAVTGACFAALGHEIVFVDLDPSKIAAINAGQAPIYEPGLGGLLQENSSRIVATDDLADAVRRTEVTFICVGTPSRQDGSIDLTYVRSAAAGVGRVLRERSGGHTVVVKSTVLPGTTKDVVLPILEAESGKRAFVDFGLASNPEFLREGSALSDFFAPDRIVIGTCDDRSRRLLEELYSSIDCPKMITAIPVAEMIKYVSNAFLATKISFANEIGNICKQMEIDTAEVFRGVGMDHRINPAFFQSGIGFGGSCFPKDVRALIARAEEVGVEPKILKDVIEVNEEQPLQLLKLLKTHVPDLDRKTIGVLGLAFKPNTDDVRESRAIPIVETLLRNGATVLAYDPMAMGNFSKLYPQINYVPTAAAALAADAVLITTEWKEFESLSYSGKIVIDGRRIERARDGSTYDGVCW